jgi:hypothetical protein
MFEFATKKTLKPKIYALIEPIAARDLKKIELQIVLLSIIS